MMNRKERREYLKKMATPQQYEARIKQIENNLRKEYSSYYEKMYQEELGLAIDNLYVTIIYTLHFNSKTKFGNERIADFMEDLIETIDMFRRKEAIPEDYIEQLRAEKIKIIDNKGETKE